MLCLYISISCVFLPILELYVFQCFFLQCPSAAGLVVLVLLAGLLIELWKVTKVVEIKFDGVVAGFLPCIKFVDRPSYKSSTRQYDIVRRQERGGREGSEKDRRERERRERE